MPQGKGTYGDQVGRPSKNKTMANGDPKKKKEAGKFQSREQAIKNIKAFGEGEGRGGTGAILSGGKSVKDKYRDAKDVKQKPAPKKYHKQAPAPFNPDKEGRIQRGPRSEGKRGKGTGWAN